MVKPQSSHASPRNPLTRARQGDIHAAEQTLPIEEMVARAVNAAEIEWCEFPESRRRDNVGSKVEDRAAT